jgi:hypothetical protein
MKGTYLYVTGRRNFRTCFHFPIVRFTAISSTCVRVVSATNRNPCNKRNTYCTPLNNVFMFCITFVNEVNVHTHTHNIGIENYWRAS